MSGLQVFQEELGPLMEKEVQRLAKPPEAMLVPIGLAEEWVAAGALVEEVGEGVGRSTATTRKLVKGDVGPEAV